MSKIPYYINVQGLGTAFCKKGLSQLVTIMYRIALKKANVVFFENEENAVKFLKQSIIRKEQVKVLKGAGINLEYYHVIPYQEDQTVKFLFVGRIMKEKGVDELFYAAKRLKKEYQDRIQFDLVGFFEDEYEFEVKKLEKDGIVKFHGFQEEVRPYYADTNCVVLPSYHEGMSNVLLEAAASGRALITSNIPGCKEAVLDGVSGYLVPAKDAKSLYEEMKRFIELDKTKREEMGLAGRKWMKEQFDKKKVVEETKKALDG